MDLTKADESKRGGKNTQNNKKLQKVQKRS